MFVLGFNFSMGRQGSLLVISFPPQEFVITQEVGGGGGGVGVGKWFILVRPSCVAGPLHKEKVALETHHLIGYTVF